MAEETLMDAMDSRINGVAQQASADPLLFARSYQLEALEKAIKQNTIVFLETGSGKTLIAIMLLRWYACQIRKPSPFFAVFLVPTVVLVTQQSDALMTHTDLKVGKYWGDLGVDYWDAAMWKKQVDEYEVLVMTPAILLDALRHSFLKFEMIKVLIFDECHNARGKHPYACIMTEFYHEHVNSSNLCVPRILGMTASPIKAKGSCSELGYWKQISELENLMNSKVYTCANESVLAEYIPFSTPKEKLYKHVDVPISVFEGIRNDLEALKQKHEYSLANSSLSESRRMSTRKRLDKLLNIFLFCLEELGVWLALKAAESSSHAKSDVFVWEKLDARGETIVRSFSLDASEKIKTWIPSGLCWSIGADTKADLNSGYLTTKVVCLVESLLEYRELKDLRCIIFVERIITAVVLQTLLNEWLTRLIGWRTAYTAGRNYGLQNQSRQEQNKIVEEFRTGKVNIIVATSVLEEGLDVQSCNLVIRFDPSATVCSFIQSRGRARMQNSDFLIMVKSGDNSTLDRVRKYLVCGKVMRQQSLSHESDPCMPLNRHEEVCYKVETTGAIVNLNSSVSLLHSYCSRLPCDGYFKPSPRFVVDKDSGSCILHLPRSCPIPKITVRGDVKMLKQLACFEACKQLHKIKALTDHLVPDIVEEEAEAQDSSYKPFLEEQAQYIPPELVGCHRDSEPETLYCCYLIELETDFEYAIKPHDIWLAVRSQLQLENDSLGFDLYAERGRINIRLSHLGELRLNSQQVHLCQTFQNAVFRVLIDHDLNRVFEVLSSLQKQCEGYAYDFLLLPSSGPRQNPSIDWKCICSVTLKNIRNNHSACGSCGAIGASLHTYRSLPLCRCVLENCLVSTPHNGHLYCISGFFDGLNANSLLKLKDDRSVTYKEYYKQRHGLDLVFLHQQLLRGHHIFSVHNCLHKSIIRKVKESSKGAVELPPEICYVVMSPISAATFYSFSYAPSILHRIESLLLAANIKRMTVNHCTQKDVIPTIKVLEAITTKRCQERIHLESLETLGDSFLKYAVSQHLFKAYENQHEGLLSIKREKIITNASLCKLGCLHKIPGHIRNEPFDPKTWNVPGDNSGVNALDVECLSSKRIICFKRGRRKIKSKDVADVVEALIGAFLCAGGEKAALSFMEGLGIEVDLTYIPYTMPLSIDPATLINIKFLESLLKYSFRDASLLVEALTHGSYMLPEIPRCYQRLEYLGDAVLDYLITEHLFNTHPGLSPGLLTDLRSASVNNVCYSRCAVRAGLHKHILHASQELHRQIASTLHNFEQLSTTSSFGWEAESMFPKVLGDVIESLAGAILVDSKYNMSIVFKSLRPLLEPMITPDMLKLNPVRELTELCQKEHYDLKKPVATCHTGKVSVEVEVEANDVVHKFSCSAPDRKTAKRLACKAVLKSLKASKQGQINV